MGRYLVSGPVKTFSLILQTHTLHGSTQNIEARKGKEGGGKVSSIGMGEGDFFLCWGHAPQGILGLEFFYCDATEYRVFDFSSKL